MDELEISGRRYITARRAGKQHGYHPDYIGQLIRGGKVVGQKVGRSWYVDVESLSHYLGEGIISESLKSAEENEPLVGQTKNEEEVVGAVVQTDDGRDMVARAENPIVEESARPIRFAYQKIEQVILPQVATLRVQHSEDEGKKDAEASDVRAMTFAEREDAARDRITMVVRDTAADPGIEGSSQKNDGVFIKGSVLTLFILLVTAILFMATSLVFFYISSVLSVVIQG